MIPDEAAWQQAQAGRDSEVLSQRETYCSQDGAKAFLNVFMRLSQAEWQELRNILPRSVFPTVRDMSDCQRALDSKGASAAVRLLRTPTGFQQNLQASIKLSMLQQLLTFVTGHDDTFTDYLRGGGMLRMVAKIHIDGFQCDNLHSGHLVGCYLNWVLLPESRRQRDCFPDQDEMKRRNPANKLGSSTLTLAMLLGKENSCNLKANLTAFADDGNLSREAVLKSVGTDTVTRMRDVCDTYGISKAAGEGKDAGKETLIRVIMEYFEKSGAVFDVDDPYSKIIDLTCNDEDGAEEIDDDDKPADLDGGEMDMQFVSNSELQRLEDADDRDNRRRLELEETGDGEAPAEPAGASARTLTNMARASGAGHLFEFLGNHNRVPFTARIPVGVRDNQGNLMPDHDTNGRVLFTTICCELEIMILPDKKGLHTVLGFGESRCPDGCLSRCFRRVAAAMNPAAAAASKSDKLPHRVRQVPPGSVDTCGLCCPQCDCKSHNERRPLACRTLSDILKEMGREPSDKSPITLREIASFYRMSVDQLKRYSCVGYVGPQDLSRSPSCR
jgi:hypothetical protein